MNTWSCRGLPRRGLGRISERGSATIEAAILTPGLLLLLALLVFAGRHAIADGAVEQAAADAARAASLERAPAHARQAASDMAQSSLSDQGLSCLSLDVDVDAAILAARPGRQGAVTVTVTCSLRVADLPLPIPATTLTSVAASPADTYRSRDIPRTSRRPTTTERG